MAVCEYTLTKGYGIEEDESMMVEPLWPTYYKSTTFKHDNTQLLCDGRSNDSAFSDCYFCAIAIYWIIDSKRWHSLFHVHASFRLVYDFTQHSGSNWLKDNLGFLCFSFLFIFCHACSTLPVSSCYLIFSLKLPSHISTIHTFCLHSCLSLIGWQVCGRRCWLIYWVLQVLVVHVWLASS